MGKAVRWLRGLLLRGKKPSVAGEGSPPQPAKEKRRWGFARSFRDKQQYRKEGNVVPSLPAETAASSREATGDKSYASSVAATSQSVPALVIDEDEQSKRAIAVAEAAVAAAQAAAAAVRLTGSGKCVGVGLYGAAERKAEDYAVRIQAAFRGFLARRALRALRGLVKLQALVSGHIVRKQAAETLRCMHALVRAQARARTWRSLSEKSQCRTATRHAHPGPPTPEKYEPAVRINSVKYERGGSLKQRNTARPADVNMENGHWDSRELSSRTGGSASCDERRDKILEVDTGKPHLKPKFKANQHSSSTAVSDPNSRSYSTQQDDSPSKDSAAQLSVPTPSSVEMLYSPSPLRLGAGDPEPCDSPHYYSAGSARRGPGPFTPTKSECSRSLFADYPNYMGNTESSRAKARSQSAPRQRMDLEKVNAVNRVRVDGACGGQSASSSSQRSASLHLKFTGKAYPGSSHLDGMGMPLGY